MYYVARMVDMSGTSTRGSLLLMLASRDPQTVAQLARQGGLSAADTVRELHTLTERGFIVVGAESDVAVYQLAPKGLRTETLPRHQRVFIVDDDAAITDVVTLVLEDEGYAVVASG